MSRDALDQWSDSGSEDFHDAAEGLEDDDDDDDDDDDNAEEFDDPDTADLEKDQLKHDADAEIPSDDALGSSDEERFANYTFRGSSQAIPNKGKRVKRPTAADFLDDEAEESDGAEDDEDDGLDRLIDDLGGSESDEEEGDEDEDMMDGEEASSAEGDEEQEDSDEDEDDEEDSDAGPAKKSKKSSGSGEAGFFEAGAGQRNVLDTLAKSIEKDVTKGRAARKQRQGFDAALNIRIRLQKSLVAVNTLPTVEETDESEPYEAAEAAAVKLWNAIDQFRVDMGPSAGQKRKRSVETTDSSDDIWAKMQELEREAVVRRKRVLDEWSNKVKKVRVTGATNKPAETSLTTVLENQMQDTERLVSRTQTPRSCAPTQAAKKVGKDPNIYDDADFYQLLLKELVDQRSADTSTGGGQAATIRFAAAKEAKTKKHVDTKASKGRKMRFGVHEKLQNFMASEDRRQWEQHAIDRFFGTLFGQKMVLDEDEASDEEMGGVNAEEAGLRLFRS